MVYGIGGLFIGVLLTLLVISTTESNYGIMRMMGFGLNNNSSTNNSGQNTMMGNIDRLFIEQMIPHHEDAITMANIAMQKAQHPEIKTLATNIKKTQSAEILKMQDWYKNWYGVDVPADNTDTGMMGQMHGGMMGSNADSTSLENASNFDKAFIEQMIPHHQMAVMMANMLLSGTNRPEMKQLAKNIIDAQTKEINEMRQWYIDWGYAQ